MVQALDLPGQFIATFEDRQVQKCNFAEQVICKN